VQRTFGEYVDTDVPPDEWDVRGLLSWIGQFGLSLTQRQVRDEDPHDLRDRIVEAALAKTEEQDLTPLEQFVDKTFARGRLARWAQDKFGVSVPVEELMQASREEAERILREHMREAYRKREVEYPVGAVLEYALERGGTNVNAVYEQIAKWANLKYRTDWTYEHFTGKDPQQIFQELTALNEDYMRNGRLNGEIDAALNQHQGEAIVEWARKRFGRVIEMNPIEPEADDLREQLQRCGYQMLRYELTMLERMVLLTTFDAVWKDHMYAMDLLRHGIGLRGYAERDPKIEYKREGTRLFRELLSNIRERVTDLVFRVQVSVRPELGDEELGDGVPARTPDGTGGAYAGATAQHADATNVGFASAAEDHEAAMKKQGEGGAAQTIRRSTPKVGRNDPCPCGSGKKYKHCHGKRA
jgi:preprotein translocase subunit SecA